MAKNKPKTPNQKLFQKEIRNLIKRVKTAEKRGFDFPEDIIPEQPKVIRKSLIERIKNLRGTKLLKKALSYFTEEQIPVKPSEGIKLEKEKRRNQSKFNAIRSKPEGNNDYLLATKGKKLVQDYTDLTVQDPALAAEFIRNLSAEDFDLFKKATKLYADEFAEREQYGRLQTGTGRETGEAVLPDEGTQYKEESDVEEAEDFDESEGTVTGESGGKQDQKTDEEIDKKYQEWKEDFERQKRKRKKDRERVYDGDSIYYDILYKIDAFKEYYGSLPSNEQDKYSANTNFATYLKNELERQIQKEGFSNVMRRLDGKGIEIDNLLETMLYSYKDDAVEAGRAYTELYKIITTYYPDQQTTQFIESATLGLTPISEDEEISGIGKM